MDNPSLRSSDRTLVLLAAENLSSDARLGFVLPKRRIRLAVARNRVKRIIRESFRHLSAELSGLDIVVLARDGLDRLDSPSLRAVADARFAFLVSRRVRAAGPSNITDPG